MTARPLRFSVDLTLPERDMARLDAHAYASGVSFVGVVRAAVRALGVSHGIRFPAPKPCPAYRRAQRDKRAHPQSPTDLVCHAVTFPRYWHLPLTETALVLGLSRAAVLRVAVLRVIGRAP